MCNKVGYSTRSAALEDARLILNQHRHFTKGKRSVVKKSAKDFNTYFCIFCGQHHLTTQKPRGYKRKSHD